MPRRNKGNELNEDLGTVIEEESVADSEMNSAFKTRDPRSLYSQYECESHLQSKLLESVIYEQALILAD